MKKTVLPLWKRWASAALLSLGLDLWSCNDIGEVALGKMSFQPKEENTYATMGIPIMPPPVTNAVGARYMGFAIAEQQAEFPGGMEAFSFYINKHIRLKHDFSGEVRARFIVERNGRIREVEITKGGNSAINKAVMRAIRHSPKWKPAKANGRKISQEVIVPVMIN